MKRIIFLLIFILLGLFLILSFLDKSHYALEKSFWYLKKDFVRLANDPKSFPDQEFTSLARRFDQLIATYPESALNGQILLQKGLVYGLMQDFEAARETFRKVLTLYPKDELLNVDALFQIGRSYEGEDKPLEAIKMYQTITDKYPLTVTGIKMPLYTANYYERLNDPIRAQHAFGKAADFYRNIYEGHSDTPIGYMALGFQATAYLAQQDWERSLDVLERLLLDFPRLHAASDPQGPFLVKTINNVALDQLKNVSRAIAIYQKFIAQYPQHPFCSGLEKLIDKLAAIQSQNPEVMRE